MRVLAKTYQDSGDRHFCKLTVVIRNSPFAKLRRPA
jgi:hypothetical protein